MKNTVGIKIINGVALLPVLWIGVLYLFAFLCWCKLGHFPVPSSNDPKGLGFTPLYFISILGMVVVFYTIVAWVLLLPLTIKKKLLTKKNVLIMIIGSMISLLQLIVDPFDLIEWLLD